jgi:hypothetical protein
MMLACAMIDDRRSNDDRTNGVSEEL